MSADVPITHLSPALLEQEGNDDCPVLITARGPDGPVVRSTLRAVRELYRAGMLESSPDGQGVRVSDAGVAYVQRVRGR